MLTVYIEYAKEVYTINLVKSGTFPPDTVIYILYPSHLPFLPQFLVILVYISLFLYLLVIVVYISLFLYLLHNLINFLFNHFIFLSVFHLIVFSVSHCSHRLFLYISQEEGEGGRAERSLGGFCGNHMLRQTGICTGPGYSN